MVELKRDRGEQKAGDKPGEKGSPPDKKTRLLAALDRGMTMIHLDARRPGVLVPDHLKGEAHLLLNLSYKFSPPDLTVSEWGVRQTLTFQGAPFGVAVPWSALYAISSHATKEFYMYPDDMPPELLASQPQAKATATPAPAPAPAPRASLREVAPHPEAQQSEPGPGPASAEDEANKKPPKRGHLRLVK